MNRPFNSFSEADQIAFSLTIKDMLRAAPPEAFLPDFSACQLLESFRAINIKIGPNISRICKDVNRAIDWIEDCLTPHRCEHCYSK
jgi:hypothetical protein